MKPLRGAASLVVRTGVGLKSYGEDVAKTRGLRLLLKNPSPRERRGLRKLYDKIVNGPVRMLTAKVLGREKEASLPLVLATSIAVFFVGDAIYRNRLNAHVTQGIEAHEEEYRSLMENDFRYHEALMGLRRGELSDSEALKETYMVNLAYQNYYGLMDNGFDQSDLSQNLSIVQHFAFTHLQDVIENGVSPIEGFLVPDEALGPIDDSQKLALFRETHELLLQYEFIVFTVNEDPLAEALATSPRTAGSYAEVMESWFAKRLWAAHEEGRITKGQLQRYLQEDAFWKSRFDKWAVLGIIKLDDRDGSLEPLSHDDIRSEMLNELGLEH